MSLGYTNAQAIKAKEEVTIFTSLIMPTGNQEVTPPEGKVMSKVTIQKPPTLLPANIKKDVSIGGVTGTLETGGSIEDLNLHFSSTTPPADLTKFWIKTDTIPEKIWINNLGTTCTLVSDYSFYHSDDFSTEFGCGVLYGTKMYLIGGYSSNTYYNSIRWYDVLTNEKGYSSVTLTGAVDGMVCTLFGDYIYIFGGYSGSGNSRVFYRDVLKYDILNDTLSTIGTLPADGLFNGGCVTVGNYIYILGGQSNDNDNSITDRILKYDPATGNFTSIVSWDNVLPYRMICFATAVLDNKIYVIGGYKYVPTSASNWSSWSKQISRDIYVIDIDNTNPTSKISNLGSLLSYSKGFYMGVYNAAAAVVGKNIYIFGGATGGGSSKIACYLNTVTNSLQVISTNFSVTGPQYNICGVIDNIIFLPNGEMDGSCWCYGFKMHMVVTPNNLHIVYNRGSSVNIDNAYLSNIIDIIDCFIGDSNNEGQRVKVARYDIGTSSWTEIN